MREATLTPDSESPATPKLPTYLVSGLFFGIVAACAAWGAIQYLNDRNQIAAYRLGGFCVSVAAVMFALFNRKLVFQQFRVRSTNWRLVITAAVVIPAFVALNYVYTNLLIGGVFGEFFTVANDSALIRQQLHLVLLIAVLPAVIEEVAFRGILQEFFGRITQARTAIGLTAILFAVSHFGLMSIPYLFLFGCFLGFLRWKSGSLLLPICAHMLHNLLVLWWI